jgi:hypothetical protein
MAMTVIPYLSIISLSEASLSIMALPDWAYTERQKIAPILVRGEVIKVSCHEVQCTLKMQILQVLRNQTDRDIAPGHSLSISFVGKTPPKSLAPNQDPPPTGLPDMSVKIPNVGEKTDAWLRPSESGKDAYDLTAGKYGFGPNIESIE